MSKADWRSRIVGHGKAKVADPLANPDNWKIHTKEQQETFLGGVKEVGFIRSVTINKRTSAKWPEGQRYVETLVDGHMRVILAMREGVEELDVECVDLNPDEEALALLILDPIAAMSKPDPEKLDALLHEVSTGEAAVQKLLDDIAKGAGLYIDFVPAPEEQKEPELKGECFIEIYCRPCLLSTLLPWQAPRKSPRHARLGLVCYIRLARWRRPSYTGSNSLEDGWL